jgi:hypothetical protein
MAGEVKQETSRMDQVTWVEVEEPKSGPPVAVHFLVKSECGTRNKVQGSLIRPSGFRAGSWPFPKSGIAEPQVRIPGPGSPRFRF